MLYVLIMLYEVVVILFCSGVNSADVQRSTECLWRQQPENSLPPREDSFIEDGYFPDLGNIHRRRIITALEGCSTRLDEDGLFRHQLTNALLRNASSQMPAAELALWISAIIAGKENPRNYKGLDLVGDLLHRVETDVEVHPYLLLTLVNAHSVKHGHLARLCEYGQDKHAYSNTTLNMRGLEMEAVALHTLACASTLPNAHAENLDTFQDVMMDMATRLISAEKDGHFGNVYATSLVVQALVAFKATGSKLNWDEHPAIDYLKEETATIGNLIGHYAIAMAINARTFPCLKDLYRGPYDRYIVASKKDIDVVLAMKSEVNPAGDFALTLKVTNGSNLFQIMMTAAELSSRFRFRYFHSHKEPVVYEIDSLPNDAHMNLYWTICFTHTDRVSKKWHATPSTIFPFDGEKIILWYRTRGCP